MASPKATNTKKSARATDFLVRIRPVKNRHPRRYTCFTIRFDEERGWYRVDPHVAKYLKQVHVESDNPDSAKLFDVCSEEEAREIDQMELDAKLQNGRAAAASPVRTSTSQAADARANPDTSTRRPQSARQPEGGDLTGDDLTRGTSRASGRSMRPVAE